MPDSPPPLAADEIAAHLDSRVKPPGSLGRLESLAAQLCVIQNTLAPRTSPRAALLFVADHGSTAAGVSAWPSSVTGHVVDMLLEGQTAAAVMARQTGTALHVIDVGLLEPPRASPTDGIERTLARIRPGTRNLAEEPALTPAEFAAAWHVGRDAALRAIASGARVLIPGELGIGNTTSAACLTRMILRCPPDAVPGPGAGADANVLARKQAVIAGTSRFDSLFDADRTAGLAAVCGLEIAAMAGCFATAREAGIVALVDGAIAGSAALVAETLAPGTRSTLIAAHRSPDPAHSLQLDALGLEPYLDSWNLRLGEGTGALALLPLIDLAAALCREMGSLDHLRERLGAT